MDLDWWKEFARKFNGMARIIDTTRWDAARIFTDSSGSGYGAIQGKDWLCGCWSKDIRSIGVCYSHAHTEHPPDEVIPENINVQELFPILTAVRRWGHNWRDKRVECFTDNMQVVSAVNQGTSVNVYSLELLRLIFWLCVDFNCHLVAVYLPGLTNIWPDFLSRIAEKQCANIPAHLCCSGGGLVSTAREEGGRDEGPCMGGGNMEDKIVTVEALY